MMCYRPCMCFITIYAFDVIKIKKTDLFKAIFNTHILRCNLRQHTKSFHSIIPNVDKLLVPCFHRKIHFLETRRTCVIVNSQNCIRYHCVCCIIKEKWASEKQF